MFPRKVKSVDISASLQRFSDYRRDPSSRAKHLRTVVESLPNVLEKRHILNTHRFETFHVMHDLLCLVEFGAISTTTLSGRSAVELELTLWILEHLLCLLPDLVAKRWQYRAIESVIKKCLLPQNVTTLRKMGVRLFLLWYQIVGSEGQADGHLDQIFAVLLPHFPMSGSGEDSETLLREYCELPNKSSSSVPAPLRNCPLVLTTSLQSQQHVQVLQMYLEKFFDYLCRETARLEWPYSKLDHQRSCLRFLLDKLKTYYIDWCFPDLDNDGVDLYSLNRSGWLKEPVKRSTLEANQPLVICRYWLIRWLTQYTYGRKALCDTLNQFSTPEGDNPDSRLPPNYELTRQLLFGSKKDVNLVLSLLRQGLFLPLQCSAVMVKVFRVVRDWVIRDNHDDLPEFLLDPAKDRPLAVGMAVSTEVLVQLLCSFFHNVHLVDEQTRLHNACQVAQRILGLIRELANPQRTISVQLSPSSWSVYLNCLMSTVDTVIPESPSFTQSRFVLIMVPCLFQTLLGAWVFISAVRAVLLPESLWNRLLRVLSSRTAWLQLLNEWGKVLDSVTRALSLYFYEIDLLDPPLDRSSEQTSKKLLAIGKTKSVDDGTLMTADDLDQYNFCQRKNESPVIDEDGRSGSGTRSSRSAKFSPNADGQCDSVSGSSPMGDKSGELAEGNNTADSISEEDGSVDSTSLHGIIQSGSDFSTVGQGSSPIFGVDRGSSTSSPCRLVSHDDDEQLDDDFEDTTEDPALDLTPRRELNRDVHTADTWMLVWRRILCIVGDINTIVNPIGHSTAMHVVTRTLDSLLKIRANQGIEPDTPFHFVPPLFWLAPWLLSSWKLPESHSIGKRDAVVALCRLFLHQPPDIRPPPTSLFCHFLLVVRNCLRSDNVLLTGQVLASICPQLFYGRIVGVELLYSDGLMASKTVMNSDADDIRKIKAVQFMAILAANRTDSIMAKEAQSLLLSTLAFCSSESLPIEASHFCINSLCLAILQSQRSRENYDQILPPLLGRLSEISLSDHRTALLICQNLSPFLDLLPYLPTIDRNKVVEQFISTYTSILENSQSMDADLKIHLLMDIVEVALKVPGDLSAKDHSFLPLIIRTVHQSIVTDNQHDSVVSVAGLLLGQLVHFHGQFPLPQFTVAQLNSVEKNDEAAKKSVVGGENVDKTDDRVFIGCSQEKNCWNAGVIDGRFTITTRSIVGKHCWDLEATTTTNVDSKSTNKNPINEWLVKIAAKLATDKKLRSNGGIYTLISEPLNELFEHIARTSPEALPHGQFPEFRHGQSLAFETDVKMAMMQTTMANNANRLLSEDNCLNHDQNISLWRPWRMFISDLGFVASRQRRSLGLIQAESAHLARSLRHLDQLIPRETHKLAMVFVADGQEDKMSILNNQVGSSRFEDFVGRLGWTVDLREHGGYAGGLSVDCRPPYYGTWRCETIFHVSTHSYHADAASKLKHLGNDEVHVVWSEHSRDYRRSTIATKFCDVLIVIYPLSDDLFRIAIDSVRPLQFGPLFDGVLVDWSDLAILVRSTALNASRACHRNQQHWTTPSHHRTSVLQRTLIDLSQSCSYGTMVGNLYGSTESDPSSLV